MQDYFPEPLVAAAKRGCAIARNDLIVRNLGLIRAAILRVVGAERTEEYLASGVVGFMRSLELFDPSKGCSCGTYGYRGVQLAVYRQLQKEAKPTKRGELSLEIWGADCAMPDGGERDEELSGRLRAVMLRLPERLRLVMGRRASGHTLEQIGKGLGLPKERVRQLVQAGVAECRALPSVA